MISTRSLRVRLTLWYILLLAIILFVFGAAVYLAMRSSLYDSLDESVENRAAALLMEISFENGRPELDADEAEGNPEPGEDFVRIYDRRGSLLFDNSDGFAGNGGSEETVRAALGGGIGKRTSDDGNRSYRTRTVPLRDGDRVVGVLEVGLTDEDLRDTLRRLLYIIIGAYPITIAGAGLSGIFLAGRTLSPIDRVTRLARRITAQDLSQRLELDLPDDELGRLARTFDDMIARLDEAFQRQRQFTADASHELRTPLTSIKGQVEVALQRDREPADYRQVLRSVNQEVDRMIRLVSSLLTLARADAGQIPLEREVTEIGANLSLALDQVRSLADEKRIEVEVRPGPNVLIGADKDLLLQLWLNLLDNAVKHTPEGGRVTVQWQRQNGQVVVDVSDTGAGIDPEHLPHIFDRFYRADTARSRALGGAGLGLAISRWITEAHGGSIEARSDPGAGATFTVRLPLS